MPEDLTAPLLVANEKEKNRTWDDLNTPKQLASWFQGIFAVDISVFKKIFNLYVGPNEPQGGDRGKVHLKTSRPFGVGALVQGSYQYVYQYPPNIPLQFPKNGIPYGVTALTPDELSSYDLTNGSSYTWAWLKV